MIQPRKLVFLVVCLAFLLMRVGGAHLHVCLDGSEAPSAMHFADSGLHHTEAEPNGHAGGHDEDAHHDDVEVNLASDLIAKLSSLDLPVIAGLLFVVLALLPWVRTPAPPTPVDTRISRSPLHLRPPLRGPPPGSFA